MRPRSLRLLWAGGGAAGPSVPARRERSQIIRGRRVGAGVAGECRGAGCSRKNLEVHLAGQVTRSREAWAAGQGEPGWRCAAPAAECPSMAAEGRAAARVPGLRLPSDDAAFSWLVTWCVFHSLTGVAPTSISWNRIRRRWLASASADQLSTEAAQDARPRVVADAAHRRIDGPIGRALCDGDAVVVAAELVIR